MKSSFGYRELFSVYAQLKPSVKVRLRGMMILLSEVIFFYQLNYSLSVTEDSKNNIYEKWKMQNIQSIFCIILGVCETGRALQISKKIRSILTPFPVSRFLCRRKW